MPRVFIIAGPNGAGKTTSALTVLPKSVQCREFVNADAIAAGLSPFQPESVAMQAGRLMLKRMRSLADAGLDFAFETTLSARSYVPLLREWRGRGYEAHLIFLWLPSPELALKRVADRVKAGGHNIPEAVVRRRYTTGIANLVRLYMPLVDHWMVYDNSGAEPRVVAYQEKEGLAVVEDAHVWNTIREMSQ